jgi:hypothetical protein
LVPALDIAVLLVKAGPEEGAAADQRRNRHRREH